MKKINVAVLGLGGMGGTHVKAAKASPWVDKITGYEPFPEKAKKRGEELGIAITTDLDIIFKDKSIALVYIAASNEAHAELAIRAMRAGKAVLCEKPMANTLPEARKMMKVQEETGAFLQIGFELHYSKLYMKAKEWIDAGAIGRVVNTHCDYFCSEFHLKGSWRSNSSEPSFLIGEKLSHYLDLPRWWIGDEVTEVYSVHAPNAVPYFRHADNHQISYRFRNGAVSTLTFMMGTAETWKGDPLADIVDGQKDDGHMLKYLICGTKGAIETDVFKRRIRRWEYRDAPDKQESRIAEVIIFAKADDNEWFHNTHGQNIRMSELVANGLPPETPAHDPYDTMRLCFGAELSEQERRIVKMDEL